MAASWESGFGEDLRKKVKEVAWYVGIALLRWLIDYLTRDNPREGKKDVEEKHVGRVPGS